MFDTTERSSATTRVRERAREARVDATREAIVEAAWNLSRREGLTGWSLRQLAKEVGLKAPTLYAYFDAKHDIFDAMFREAWYALNDVAATWLVDPDRPRASMRTAAHGWFEFSTSDLVRFQLMNQRVINGFEPSPEAYAASVSSYENFAEQFAAVGVTDPAHLDLWTAICSGLASQQLANDPGGSRWERLIDDAVDLFCDHVGLPPDPPEPPAVPGPASMEER